MNLLRTLTLLLLASWLGSTTARAQGPSPTPGTCAYGTANNVLDVNNVAATVYNTGSLFFGGSGQALYLVPQAAELSPIFAAGIWIGGKVGNETRIAAATYDDFQFWPGPLGANGRPVNPADCTAYDRIWSVSRQQIIDYEGGAAPAADLVEWPADLGAPVIDGDGVPGNYNLAGGDRPDIVGDQGLWWVMNDVGNVKPTATSNAMGVEVRVLAFSFDRDNALGNTTFYRYSVLYKGSVPLTNTYLSVFSDPDLGNASDDYVHSDTTLSMGVVYNADELDESATGYGSPPPALGIDFFQGPVVADDTLGLSSASYFINGGPAGTQDPANTTEYYNYMQGLWGDGTQVRQDGNGHTGTGAVTTYAFPGDPVRSAFWSEENTGSAGRNTPGDRRLIVTTGPFTLNPGDEQDIVFGIVYAQGINRLSSISALRAADLLAQSAYDLDFELPTPPPAPPLCQAGSGTREPGSGNCLDAVETNGVAAITWGYPQPAGSQTYITAYEDSGYEFEGFNVYRYPNSQFNRNERELVATYDVVNGIGPVNNLVFDPIVGEIVPVRAASGNDNGIQFSYVIDNATNYQDYFFGVSAYAVDQSQPLERVIESAPTQITVRPSNVAAGNGGSFTQATIGDPIEATPVVQAGEGIVTASVIDPTAITGDTYQVEFFTQPDTTLTNYRIVNVNTGRVIFDGADYYARTGEVAPQQQNVAVGEGLVFSVQGPEPGFSAFITTANANGPLDPPEMAAGALPGFSAAFPIPPFPTVAVDRPTEAQQATTPAEWMINQGSDRANAAYSRWLELVVRNDNQTRIGAHDFEMRFTATGGLAFNFETEAVIPVPFEIWDAGIGTPNDPSDDVKLVPLLLDDFVQASAPDGGFNLGNLDHALSGGNDDPYTDRVYWYQPTDMTPGTAGYDAAFAGAGDTGLVGGELFARWVLVNWNGGQVAAGNYNAQLPEVGTVFRMVTFKPNQPGDIFAINTASLRLVTGNDSTAQAALDAIGVVPNPYLGRSEYESGNQERRVRFTNMPDEATIRIYTVSGTLIKTLFAGGRRSVDWNLETENNLPVASGMYLIHVETPLGERVLKLGVVNRQTQVDIF